MYPEKFLSHHFCTKDQLDSLTISKIKRSESVIESLRREVSTNLSQEKQEFLTDLSKKVGMYVIVA